MSAQSSTSTFRVDEVKCAATLRLPEGTGPFPAILMVHGWGGVQDALTLPFYEPFNQAGFAVMTFDYSGWAKSEGTPRNAINPWQREREVEKALEHLRAQPEIDADRIVLWGTSFGGGHVVRTAAKHPELLGAITQVPMLDGMAAVKAVPPLRMLRFGLYALADLIRGKKRPVYVPVVAPPGEWASMDRDGAAEAMQNGLKDLRDAQGPEAAIYDNRVAARSLLTMGLYRPFKSLKQVKIPILIVGATRDSVAPFVEGKIRALNNPNITIEKIDANHFDPYFDPALTTNLGHQLTFLRGLPTP
jgi:pimeloyl-ACP methyl ester carboxylesterase